MSRLPSRVLAVAALLAAALAVPAMADAPYAGPPTEPTCLPLAAGTTGVLVAGNQVSTPTQLAGGNGLGDVATIRLPERVWWKDGRHAISNRHAFALRGGDLYARPATKGRSESGTPWRVLSLPDCLAGNITHVSADHRLLLVTTADGQVYSHDMPGGDISPERWTWRWGPYFWTGSGARLPTDTVQWAASEFTSAETFTDTSGRKQHPIGVATLYLLRHGGRRLTYLDPWLPVDESREVCLPDDGRARLAGMDASGSTILAATRDGRLFTRLYDFDVSGANTVLGSYSWDRPRPASDTAWQLPGPRWARHNNPPGTFTDRVSIVKTGEDASDRELRVEGSRRGRTGIWVSQIDSRRWRFVATGKRLRGRVLPLPTHDVRRPARTYLGDIAGAPVQVKSFDWACSPTAMRVKVGGEWLRLRLHSFDGLRQSAREVGLDDVPREYNGAIELLPRVRRNLTIAQKAWAAARLDGRFTTAPLSVTATRLKFLSQCWELTLNGDPARPDAIVTVPDPAIEVGRLTEMQQDGRDPSAC